MLSFHVNFMQIDGRTDIQTDGQTDNGKTICPPIFRYGGIKRQRMYLRMVGVYGP